MIFGTGDNIQLGKPFGIRLGASRLLLIWVAAMSVYGLATKNVLQALWLPLLFVSIYAHELGHALAARRLGGHVEEIVLHLFGGLTRTSGVRGTRGRVILSAAGPAVSLALGVGLYAAGRSVTEPVLLSSLLGGLGILNIVWAVFNLLPIFPLDGGQIFGAIILRRMPPDRAMALTAIVSLVFIGAAAVAAIIYFRAIFVFFILGALAWMNVQQLRMAGQAKGAVQEILGSLRQRADAAAEARERRAAKLHVVRDVHDDAHDSDLVAKLLRRAIERDLGALSPHERRVLVVHRNLIEAELAAGGFEALDDGQKELLALHHELDARRSVH